MYLSWSNSPLRHQKESFGLGTDRADDRLGRQRLVAYDLDSGNRQPTAFVDMEIDRRGFLVDRGVDRDLGEKVALALVQRIDARHVLRHLRRIDRLADDQVDAVFDGAGRHFVRARDPHVAQNAAFTQIEDENRLPRRALARDLDVGFELVGGVEVFHRARKNARIDRRFRCDADVGPQHVVGEPTLTPKGHAVRCCARPDLRSGLCACD